MSLSFFNSAAYREQKIATWLSAGVLVFVTAFLWAPSRDGLEIVYAFAVFIPVLILLFARHKFDSYGGKFTFFALLFAAYSALSAMWSSNATPGFFILQWVVLATWLIGLVWVAQRGLLDTQKLIDWLLLVGVVLSLINLWVFYQDHPLSARLSGWSVTRNPNHIASIYGTLVLLAYIQCLRAQTAQKTLYYLSALVILGVSVAATQSRSAFVALAILLPVAALLFCRTRAKWLLNLALLSLLGAFVFSQHEQLQSLLLARGLSLRDLIWTEVWAQVLERNPLWGVGLEKEGRILLSDGQIFNHAHNAWLDILYRTGVVGLLLSSIYFFYLLVSSLRQPELYPLVLWLVFGFIYSAVDSRGFFWQIDPKWFCVWLPAGLLGALLSGQPHRNIHHVD